MIFKQADSGFDFSFKRNTDTPDKIQSVIDAETKIGSGVGSVENDLLAKKSKSVPDAKRSAADYLVLATNSWSSKKLIDGITYVKGD